ncbi:hypothetical protein ACI2KR_08400 [Pseudomonas luteola]
MSKKPYHVSMSWLVTIFVIELVYVLSEFAFNAALLNVASGLVGDIDAIHSVEVVGRLLSGLGLSILLYWTVFRKRLLEENVSAGLKMFGLSLLLCVPTMYFGQKIIVEKIIVDGTTGFERQYAESLMLLKKGLQNNIVDMDAFEQTSHGITKPEDMTFLSLMGGILMGIPEYAEVLSKSESQIVTKLNRVASEEAAVKVFPAYEQGSQKIIEGFRSYAQASAQYNQLYRENRSKVEKAWNEVASITADGYNKYRQAVSHFTYMSDDDFKDRTRGYARGINSLTAFRANQETINRINSITEPNGIVINQAWNGTQEDFMRIMSQGGLTAWGDEMAKRGTFGLLANLSFKQFEQSRVVQDKLKSAMGDLYVKGMRAGLSRTDFIEQIVMPANASKIQVWLENAKGRQYELADGGAREEEGRQFVRALIVPPIALSLSLFFSLLTLAKLPIRLISFKDGYQGNIPWVNKARRAIMAGDLVLILSLPMTRSDSKFMDSKMFHSITQKGKGFVPLGDKAIIWVIKGEPLIYKTGLSILKMLGLDQRDDKFKGS